MTTPPMPTAPITTPAAWLGADLSSDTDAWMHQLTTAEIADLENAARHYLSLSKDIGEITKADFPLAHFHTHLTAMRKKLLRGIGVEVLRGLPIQNYTQEFAATIFCGIGTHLGQARSQNALGHILGHVRDVGASAEDLTKRIYQTAERQTFHTDSADVVALLCIRDAKEVCIRDAKEGGRSLLVSAVTIFNRMAASRPDLLRLLFDPIATDRRGEIPEGAKPYMEIPVFNWHAGNLTVFYQRQYIDSAQRFDGAMRLTAAHIEALDMFDALANDPDLNIAMQLVPGDMQFVYNHTQLHDRTAFTDWPDPAQRRHLLRLWLSMPGDRALPACFAERYGSIEIGNRGGIVTNRTRLSAPLD